MEKYYTVSEASEILGISERQVLNWIHDSKLDAKKDGRTWLIFSDLAKFNGNEKVDFRSPSEQLKFLNRQIGEIKERNSELLQLNSELLRQLDETKQRSDTIILHLTQQNQILLENLRNRSLWTRIKIALGFEAS